MTAQHPINPDVARAMRAVRRGRKPSRRNARRLALWALLSAVLGDR